MAERVLVAGGAGFLGSHLCRALYHEGYEVVCLDNLSTGRRENLVDLIDKQGFTFIHYDLTQERLAGTGDEEKGQTPALAKLIGTVNYILHLASPASPVDYAARPVDTLLTNSLGTYHLLEVARRLNARFLLASTSEVYGSPQVHPQPEDYWGYVNPVGWRSCYDEGKRFAEALAMTYFRQGLDVRVVRIFNTYGPGMKSGDGRVIPNFIEQARAGQPLTIYGDGRQTRSFCYISDLIAGLFLATFTPGLAGKVFNLGNPEEVTVLELAQLIKRLTNSPSAIVFLPPLADDPPRRCPDITQAQKWLGWRPTVSLEEGLRRMLLTRSAVIQGGL